MFCLTVWTFSAPQSTLAAPVAALFVMLVGAGAMVFKPTDCIEFDQGKLDKTAAVEAGVLWAVSRSTLIKQALVQLFRHLLYCVKYSNER